MISIIIPIYNAECFIKHLFDSILHQSTNDFEVILIDDGSTDSSGIICEEYASRHSMFKVFHKQNEGVSVARNFGIKKARGEWILFVDADDELELDAISLYKRNISQNTDCILTAFKYITPNSTKECFHSIEKNTVELTNEEALLKLFGRYLYYPFRFGFQSFVWYGLYRRELLLTQNIRFDNRISINEDGLFLVQYLCNCKQRIIITNDITYNYYVRENSTMTLLSSNVGLSDKFISSVHARFLIYKTIHDKCLNKRLFGKARDYVLYFILKINLKHQNLTHAEYKKKRIIVKQAKELIGIFFYFHYIKIKFECFLIFACIPLIKNIVRK